MLYEVITLDVVALPVFQFPAAREIDIRRIGGCRWRHALGLAAARQAQGGRQQGGQQQDDGGQSYNFV